jgi:hypothetical protein
MADANGLPGQAAGFTGYLYGHAIYPLLFNPELRLSAWPGESERDFRARCRQGAREARDAAVDELASKYHAQLARLDEQHARAQQELARAQAENEAHQQAGPTGLGSLIGALGLFGRRGEAERATASPKTAATHGAYGAHAYESEALAEISRIQGDAARAQQQMRADAEALTQRWSQAAANIQAVRLTPHRTGIQVRWIALAWAGSWEIGYMNTAGQARVETVPAYPLT